MSEGKMDDTNRWLAHEPVDDGRINLVCFPYAGGTSAMFTRWRMALPDWINICPVVFPGRESLIKQPAETDFTTLADKLATGLLPQLKGKRFALYGHSMGAWFAHDLAIMASTLGFAPSALLVSGQRAPQIAYPFTPNREMNDATLLDFILSFGGIDTELLNNQAWVSWMLELLRADLSLCETHPPVTMDTPLDCELHLFANDSDPLVKLEAQMAWRQQTSGGFSHTQHKGGHFFIRSDTREFLYQLAFVLEHLN